MKQDTKNKICVSCGDLKPCRSKKMCRKCYARDYRTTEKGKEALKKYNQSEKAKACRKKWKLVKYPNIVPRKVMPKVNCVCGRKAIAKGLCERCYQRNRLGSKPRTPKTFLDVETFKILIKLLESGKTITKACKTLNLKSATLYQHVSEKQRHEISEAKVSGHRPYYDKKYLDI